MKKSKESYLIALRKYLQEPERMVPPTRIERAARGLGNRCSIQLSYGGSKHTFCAYLTELRYRIGESPVRWGKR